jgi:ATP-binding cassette subfamily C protein
VRVAASLDERLSGRVYDLGGSVAAATAKTPGDGLAHLRDLDQIRSFLVTTGPLALFDLPWMPNLCADLFPVPSVDRHCRSDRCGNFDEPHAHVGIHDARTLAHDDGSRGHTQQHRGSGRRNAEVLKAMGMAPRMGKIWGEANTKYLLSQQKTSDVAGGSVRSRRCCASRCNPRCLGSVPIW